MNYLERDAELIRRCLPAGTDVPPNSLSLFRMYAVLLRCKGSLTRLEDVHDAWTAWISESEPEHQSAVPFSQLDSETKSADEPFLAAILKAAAGIDDENSGLL